MTDTEAAAKDYTGPTCNHPHNLPYNDECAVWWLRGTEHWRAAHTNLAPAPSGMAVTAVLWESDPSDADW